LCVHGSSEIEGEKPGFDFLGFNIRQFPKGKHQSGKNTQGEKLGFKTIITPSQNKIKVHYDNIARVIDAQKSAPQAALIKRINPIIRGWANTIAILNQLQTNRDSLIVIKLVLIQAFQQKSHIYITWENEKIDNELPA